MKYIVAAAAIVFTCLAGSCTQRTCPTYTKGIEKAPQEQQQVKAREDKKV